MPLHFMSGAVNNFKPYVYLELQLSKQNPQVLGRTVA